MLKLNEQVFKTMADKSPVGIIVTNLNYLVMYFNTAANKLFNLKGSNFIKLDDILPINEIKLNSREVQEINCNQCTYAVNIEKINLGDSKLITFYIRDITQQAKEEERLRCLDAAIDSVSDGVIACDSRGHVVVYNKQISQAEGMDKSEVLGKHYFDIWGLSPEDSYFLSVYKTGKPRLNETWNFNTKTGKEINYLHSTYPVIKDGKTVGVYCLSKNVSQIRKLLVKTIELQEKLSPSEKGKTYNNGTRYSFKDIIGESEAIKATIKEAIKAAQGLAPVMVYGETGTGKELFVQSIHNASLNNNEPFIAINCAAIPETLLESTLFGTVKGAFTGAEDTKGLFEQAGKGTLFLDEINSMPQALQAKLLRVIQEKTVRRLGANEETPVFCRVISSTNIDPWQCVHNRTIRQDLYYRLTGIYLRIPPLRERKGDIECLAKYFLNRYSRIYGKGHIKLSKELIELFEKHSWPGNVRELEYVIEGSVSMLDSENCILTAQHLPSHLRAKDNQGMEHIDLDGKNLVEKLESIEKRLIFDALNENNWNISHTSNYLGIKRQTLQYKINKFNIEKDAKS